MESLAYLSVLLIPVLMGVGILAFFGWEFYKDRRREGPRKAKLTQVIVTILFWILFVGYFVWRAQTGEG